jgi:hypothetical protein
MPLALATKCFLSPSRARWHRHAEPAPAPTPAPAPALALALALALADTGEISSHTAKFRLTRQSFASPGKVSPHTGKVSPHTGKYLSRIDALRGGAGRVVRGVVIASAWHIVCIFRSYNDP